MADLGHTLSHFWQVAQGHGDLERLLELRAERLQHFHSAPEYRRFQDVISGLPKFKSVVYDAGGPAVTIGSPAERGEFQNPDLDSILKAFMPWKKGPFKLFGTEIDSEWRSDWKWERLLPFVEPLEGRLVCDIGCHNGYYMFRMSDHSPKFVLGIEPVAKHWFLFQFLNQFAGRDDLALEPFGVEHMDGFHGLFDTIFCLGILYHHTDPMGILRKVHQALRPGGQVLIDCAGIPGEESSALVPHGRYAGSSGVWFLPTSSCLETWLKRANFRKIKIFYDEPLSVREQRTAPWAPGLSLADFLDPVDPGKTREGYPAPRRFYVTANR